MTAADLDAFLEAHLDEYLAETAALCRLPTISALGEANSDVMAACAEQVAGLLAARGFAAEVLPTPGHPVVVARAEGESERTLLFYNHYDVQPPEPLALWTSPPFEPTLRDGALYARGAKDDKGELLARVAAVDTVRAAHNGRLPCGVLFVVEGQEEVGSPHIAAFVREHAQRLRCHGALWEEGGTTHEGNPGMVLGRRGILSVALSVQTLARDAHSGSAHLLPNAAWRLVRALNTLQDASGRILIPGFYDRALPPSPLDEQLMEAQGDREAWLRQNYGVSEFVGGARGLDLNRAVFNPTANIQGLTAGYQGPGMKTVIPAQASAKLDFRLVPDQDPDEIEALLRQHLAAAGFGDVQVARLGAMWPYRSAPDDPLVQLAARTGEAVYQRPYVLEPLAGGSSPMYAFGRPLGNIPMISAGVGYGYSNRTHAPDEHVRVQDFLNAARHIARILDGFAAL